MLESLKKDVVAMAKRAQKEGLCKHLSGNLSARDPETGYVCITPSGMPYQTLHPSDIVVIDVDCNIIDGERRPSIEAPLHTAVYKKRDDVFGVVHTHSTFCTAWACRGKTMPCITSEGAELVGGTVKCATFVPPGSAELAEVTSEALGNDSAVLMGNHGVICLSLIHI